METTQYIPADVREPTDAQINVWSVIRSALSRAWALSRPWAVADRPQVTSEVVARLDAIAADCEREVLALLRTPRGDGEAWCEFLAEMIEFEAAANLWVDPEGPSAEDMARLDRARQRVIECARALATLRPEAKGEAEALAALVVRIWTRCQNEGPNYRETDEFWADFERAYQLAALRSEAHGEDRWEDLVFGPITEAYNEAHAARRGEGGGM